MHDRDWSIHAARSFARCAVMLAAISGCDDRPQSEIVRADATSSTVRIVSLSPGVSATIAALGLEAHLVGRTPWCQVSKSIPIVGSLLDIDAEMIVRTKPTIVIVQPPAQGSVPMLDTLAREHQWKVARVNLESLDDVKALIDTLPALICDKNLESSRERIQSKSRLLCAELDRVLRPIDGAAAAGRVLIILANAEGADALGFGSDTYLSDALVRMGGTNALTRLGYPAFGSEDLVRIAPDTVVVIGARSQDDVLALAKLLPSACVQPLNAPELMQPGGGMLPGLAKFRGAIEDAVRARAASSVETSK